MHLGAFTVGLSYLIAQQISGLVGDLDARLASTAAMSILFTGVLLMLTRRAAISQIVGFLVLENGIYLFTVTQTHGMPLLVEMGLLLEVLVAVMVAGLLLFNIKRSFEHIDVSQLTELKD
jgi:hydrogenase-4 component E